VLTLDAGPRAVTAGVELEDVGADAEAPGESPEQRLARREMAQRFAGLVSKLKPNEA
jgi:hypothetical protein